MNEKESIGGKRFLAVKPGGGMAHEVGLSGLSGRGWPVAIAGEVIYQLLVRVSRFGAVVIPQFLDLLKPAPRPGTNDARQGKNLILADQLFA